MTKATLVMIRAVILLTLLSLVLVSVTLIIHALHWEGSPKVFILYAPTIAVWTVIVLTVQKVFKFKEHS